MRSVFRPVEMGMAVDAGVRRASTLASMRVQLLLGEDVAAVLVHTRAIAASQHIGNHQTSGRGSDGPAQRTLGQDAGPGFAYLA